MWKIEKWIVGSEKISINSIVERGGNEMFKNKNVFICFILKFEFRILRNFY